MRLESNLECTPNELLARRGIVGGVPTFVAFPLHLDVTVIPLNIYVYILLFLWFIIGDHCSCFSDGRFQLITAIFKSDGSTFLCTYYARGGQML